MKVKSILLAAAMALGLAACDRAVGAGYEDATTNRPDATLDAGIDSRADARPDAQPDAEPQQDAQPDAGPDAYVPQVCMTQCSGTETVPVQRSGDFLTLYEHLHEVVETFDTSDAPAALTSYTLTSGAGTTDVNQFLRMVWGFPADSSNSSSARFIYGEDDDDNLGLFLLFEDNDPSFRYELEFANGWKSFKDPDGTLRNYLGKELTMLGEKFMVTKAHLDDNTGKLEMHMFADYFQADVPLGSTKQFQCNGETYTVFASNQAPDGGVDFNLDGEGLGSMYLGDTQPTLDHVFAFTKIVDMGQGPMARFVIGSRALMIDDYDTTGQILDGNLDVDNEAIEDNDVDIQFTDQNGQVNISKLVFQLYVDGIGGYEPYLAPGEGLKQWIDEPEGMVSKNWDFTFIGHNQPGTTDISLRHSGNDEIRLEFTNYQGINYSSVRVAANINGLRYGDDDNALVFMQGTNMTDPDQYTVWQHDYVVLTDLPSKVTRIVRMDSVDDINHLVQFTDVGTGAYLSSNYSGTLSACPNFATGQINVGGQSFDYAICDSTDGPKMLIDVDNDGNLGGEAYVFVENGGFIDLGAQSTTDHHAAVPTGTTYIAMVTPMGRMDEATQDLHSEIEISAQPDGSLDMTVVEDVQSGFRLYNDNAAGEWRGMDPYGALFTYSLDANNNSRIDIAYPDGQFVGDVSLVFNDQCTQP